MLRLIPVALLALVLCVPTVDAAPSSPDRPIDWFSGLWTQLTGWIHGLTTTVARPGAPLDFDTPVIIPVGSSSIAPSPVLDFGTPVVIPEGAQSIAPTPVLDFDTPVIIPEGARSIRPAPALDFETPVIIPEGAS